MTFLGKFAYINAPFVGAAYILRRVTYRKQENWPTHFFLIDDIFAVNDSSDFEKKLQRNLPTRISIKKRKCIKSESSFFVI